VTDPRPTPPERVPVADVIAALREVADDREAGEDVYLTPEWMRQAAAALEAVTAERDRLSAKLAEADERGRHRVDVMGKVERERDRAAAERDRALATLREILAYPMDPAHPMKRLARERLENP